MIYLKGGQARTVLVTRRYAFKIPRLTGWQNFLWGLLCNMQEADLGRRGWPELCPVLFALPGGFLVVMPRVDVCTEATAPTEADYRRLTDQPGKCIPVEWKPDSWGRLPDGRLVAVDYG